MGRKIQKITGFTPQAVGKHINELVKENMVIKTDKAVKLKRKLDLPDKLDSKYDIENKIKLGQMLNADIEKTIVDEKTVQRIPQLFEECDVKEVTTLFKPVWKVTYEDEKGNVRIQKFDAI